MRRSPLLLCAGLALFLPTGETHGETCLWKSGPITVIAAGPTEIALPSPFPCPLAAGKEWVLELQGIRARGQPGVPYVIQAHLSNPDGQDRGYYVEIGRFNLFNAERRPLATGYALPSGSVDRIRISPARPPQKPAIIDIETLSLSPRDEKSR